MARYTHDVMIERNAWCIKSCLGQGEVLSSQEDQGTNAHVAQNMSKTHVRANTFITLFLGREAQRGIRIYSPYVADESVVLLRVQMAIWGNGNSTHGVEISE